MKKHYHVLIGLEGGYMPDSNDIFDNITDARNAALESAKEYREDYDENGKPLYHVSGNKRDGYYCQPADSETSLATLIDIVECQEVDCQNEETW